MRSAMSRIENASSDRLFWMRSSCSESSRLRSLMRVCASRSCCTSCTVYRQNARMTMTVHGQRHERDGSRDCRREALAAVGSAGGVVSADMSRRRPVSTQAALDHPSDAERDVFFPVPRHDLDADRQSGRRRRLPAPRGQDSAAG